MSEEMTAEGKQNPGRALRVAAIQGDADAVSALLSGGADVNAADPRGWTPLMLAAQYGRIETVRLLCDRGADIGARNVFGSTAPLYSAWRGRVDVELFFFLRGYSDVYPQIGGDALYPPGASLFRKAIERGRGDIVTALLDSGVDLTYSAEFGQRSMNLAVAKNDEPMLRLLLERGADVNRCPSYEPTVLMIAAGKANPQMVALLLRNGAEVNAVRQAGRTALTFAREALARGREFDTPALTVRAAEVIDLLRRAGATE